MAYGKRTPTMIIGISIFSRSAIGRGRFWAETAGKREE
jgi:hypothetical protein